MVDYRKRLTTNIVFLLSSLSAVLSMAVHIFMALLLHLKTRQEFLTAQATLKRNEFVCRAKRKRSKESTGRTVSSRVGLFIWSRVTETTLPPSYPMGRRL